MVVLDSFPFQEDDEVQYLGGVRRSANVSAGHPRQTEVRFNSPEITLVGSEDYSSTAYEGRESVERVEDTHGHTQQFKHSQGYMEGATNSQGYMKCRLCHYQTKIESLLRRHVIKHSLDSDFRCPACDFRENDPRKFVEHIGTHQSGKLVRCCFCPKKMSRGKLKSHIRIHRAVELYDCSMCQFSTNYEKTIKSHMDVYHSKEYSCQQCGQIMTKHDLHWHMKFVHSMEPTETVILPDQTVPLPVPAGRGTNSKTPKDRSKIIQNQPIFSRKYGVSKISRNTSIALKMQKHGVTKKQFNCGKCDYKTSCKKLLRAHRAKHLLDNSLVCTKCGFKETGPGKFASHLALHSPNDWLQCCFCYFKTPTRGTMSNHVIKHKPVPMFDCSECDFSAKRPASVRIHTANVHGKRSRCKSCGTEMSRFAMVSHRKECRSSNVPDSGSGPSTSSQRTEHYETDIAPDASYDSGGFNQQEENTVPCEFCKKPYAKSYVRKHIKKCQLENSPNPESKKIPGNVPDSDSGPSSASHRTDLYETDIEPDASYGSGGFNQEEENTVPCEFCKKTYAKSYVRKHIKKCQLENSPNPESKRIPGNVPDSGSGPSSASHRTDHYETDIEPDTSHDSGGFNQQEENTVPCEFCKKPYAKSYVRKHIKKCQLENSPNPESEKVPELQPVGTTLANNEVAAAAQNPSGIDDHLESAKSYNVGLLTSASPSKSCSKPRKPRLQCNSCLFKTRKKRLLKKHAVKHLIDFRLTCPECGHKEMSSFRFAQHIMQHGSDPETFQCCFCSLSAPTSKRSYCAHLDLHRPVNIFDCPKCDYSSYRADSVRSHCKNNHSKNRKCQHCGEVMSKVRLFKHLMEFHGDVKDVNFKLGKTDGTEPTEANYSFSHPPSTHQVGFNIEDLGGQSNTEWQYSEDGMQALVQVECCPPDIETSLYETDQDFLKCTKCTFKTKIQSLMDRHVAKHLIDVPFVCPLCGFEHISSRKFANHWDKHECNAKKKMYQCCFCDAEIKKKNCLKAFLPQHIEDHRRIALQDCPECEFSSHSRYELDKHYKNQHVKKCKCLLCGEVMTIFENSFHTECKGSSEGINDSAETANRIERQSVDFSTLRRHSAEVQESLIADLEGPASFFDSESSALADGSAEKAHPEARPSSVTKKYMHCSSCDYSTQIKPLLERHVLKHLIDVPFSCKQCCFSSFAERPFADHIFTHTGFHKCNFCSHRAGNATAATRHYSSHKALAMNDCPKCEYTSTYKYRLLEHLRGKHVDVPRCSYCGKKTLKDELNSHERLCGTSLRSRFFGYSKSSSAVEMMKNGLDLALDDTTPRAFPMRCEQVEALSNQDSGVNDGQFSPVQQTGCADDTAVKGWLLHELNLSPTQGHVSTGAESSQRTDGINMQGPVHNSAGILSSLSLAVGQIGSVAENSELADSDVVGMTHETNAVTDLSGQRPGLEDPACHASSTERSSLYDYVPVVIQEPNSTAVRSRQDPIRLASTTATSPQTDDVPIVIQETMSTDQVRSVIPSKDLARKPSVCLVSLAATSPHTDDEPKLIQESIAAAVTSRQAPVLLVSSTDPSTMSIQDPGLRTSVCLASGTVRSPHADDVPMH